MLSGVLALEGCAEGTEEPNGPSGDAQVPEDTALPPLDTGAGDTGSLPEDTGTVPEDTGTVPEDTGSVPTDTGTVPLDTGVPVVDSGTGFDSGFPVDSGVVMDSGVAVRDSGSPSDTGVRDGGTGDVPTDTTPPTDGGTCPGGQTCGTTCVTTAANAMLCPAAESLGAWCGDTSCGVFCPPTSFRTVSTRTGRGSRWFRARTMECSSCPASITARVNLTVPAGTDYDLFVYGPCGMQLGSSQVGVGARDSVTVTASDTLLSGDEYLDYYIEVRHYSGPACENWTLTVDARGTTSGC